jgi:hypothetical protein
MPPSRRYHPDILPEQYKAEVLKDLIQRRFRLLVVSARMVIKRSFLRDLVVFARIGAYRGLFLP